MCKCEFSLLHGPIFAVSIGAEVTMTGTPGTETAETTALEAFWYLAGSRDDLERLPRIDAYDKRIHDEMYVPKHLRG